MLNSISKKALQVVSVIVRALVLSGLIMWAFGLPVRAAY
jgi:hypothetical protein